MKRCDNCPHPSLCALHPPQCEKTYQGRRSNIQLDLKPNEKKSWFETDEARHVSTCLFVGIVTLGCIWLWDIYHQQALTGFPSFLVRLSYYLWP